MNEVPSVAVVFSVISIAAAATAVIFVASFRFGMQATADARDADEVSAAGPGLPRARLRAAASMTRASRLRWWSRDVARHALRISQAAVIAVGITATFLMFVCLLGFVVLAAVA